MLTAHGLPPLGRAQGPLIVNGQLLSSSAFQNVFTAAKAGTQKPVLVMGDSLSFSYASGSTPARYRYNAVQNKLSDILATGGIRSSANGWLGNGGLHSTGTALQYDDRQVNGSPAWSNGVASLGGLIMFANNTAATWVFTPKNEDGTLFQCDRLDFYYYQFSGAGHLTYTVDAGTPVDVNCNGGNAPKKIAITGLTLGTHTLTVTWVSGQVYFMGGDAFNSSLVGLKFINSGINGGLISDFTANAHGYDPLYVAANGVVPSLAFMLIGANYWLNGAGFLSTFQSNLAALISGYASICPLILVSDIPTDPSLNPLATFSVQQSYVNAMISAANSNNLVMFNEWQSFGGASANFDSRWNATDHIHGSASGYQQIAQDIATPILAA